jgi:hypothetical protein
MHLKGYCIDHRLLRTRSANSAGPARRARPMTWSLCEARPSAPGLTRRSVRRAVGRPLEALLDPLALGTDGLDEDGHFCTHLGSPFSLARAIGGVNRRTASPCPSATGVRGRKAGVFRPRVPLARFLRTRDARSGGRRVPLSCYAELFSPHDRTFQRLRSAARLRLIYRSFDPGRAAVDCCGKGGARDGSGS